MALGSSSPKDACSIWMLSSLLGSQCSAIPPKAELQHSSAQVEQSQNLSPNNIETQIENPSREPQ